MHSIECRTPEDLQKALVDLTGHGYNLSEILLVPILAFNGIPTGWVMFYRKDAP